MVVKPTGVLVYERGSNMKLPSRPINWSPILAVLLFSALAIPGNAYSQQSDRVSKQQEHKRRATTEDRSSKKAERAAPREASKETRREKPAARDRSAASRQAPANAAPRNAQRSAPGRTQQRRPDTSNANRNTARPTVAPEQRNETRTAPADRNRNNRGDNRGRDPASTPPRAKRISNGEQTGRPTDRRAIAAHDNNRNSRQVPVSRPSQTTGNRENRNPGNRDGDNNRNNNRDQARQDNRPRQPNRDQARRIRAEQQRANRYFAAQTQHRNAANQRARILQQQRRNNQYRYQVQYQQRLQRQHAQWNSSRYDYYNDPFYYTPASYRYQYGGQWQTTNRYGADLMQQAVDYGYQEGLRAGRADSEDGWRADYGNSYAYQDGSYGYNGRYISPSEYQYYFRQGFRRGYQDGYDNRHQYGYRRDDGSYAIVAAVLATIVGLHLLN